MQIDWLNILSELFDIVIIPIIGAATLYLVTLIKAKKQELLEKTKNDTINKYIDLLDETITQCVFATTQTYVETLKKQNKFDVAAQKEAFRRTYEAIMTILTDDAKIYLNEAIKDLDTYITNRIEYQVVMSKGEQK